ncbi:MAG: PASTA domain-containing protein [Candidatus Eremiobacteraeota bacterium]|nr:PASTA domain-containing protein [Candidatus Eremiobacteraeota bacterium]
MLAAFVGVTVWFGHQIHDFLLPPVDEVTIPSFIGQTLGDANNAAERMHLTSQVIDHATSDRYPKGVVMNQRPDAGTKVRQGRQVGFVVSDGIVTRLMPDMRYQSMREVGLDLSRTRLQLGRATYVKSDVVPEGHVIAQDPQPLTNVLEGDKVDLVISKGGSQFVRVPNFVNMKIDGARSLADKMGVKIGQVVWTPLGKKGPPHGVVARQSIAPGTRIGSYDQVSLQVSAGPNESGYLLRQVRVLASVPTPQDVNPGESVKLTLRVRDATGEYDAFRGYAQPGQKLDFTVTAIGTSVVDMYVNDVLVGETRLGNEPPKVYDQGKKSPSPEPSETP